MTDSIDLKNKNSTSIKLNERKTSIQYNQPKKKIFTLICLAD